MRRGFSASLVLIARATKRPDDLPDMTVSVLVLRASSLLFRVFFRVTLHSDGPRGFRWNLAAQLPNLLGIENRHRLSNRCRGRMSCAWFNGQEWKAKRFLRMWEKREKPISAASNLCWCPGRLCNEPQKFCHKGKRVKSNCSRLPIFLQDGK
jgi:hypothetical protein